MRRQLFAFIFVALPLAAAMAAQSGRAGAAVDRAALDPKADACTDFYQFACGGWVAANPVPPDRQRLGRFKEVLDRNFAILRRILEEPARRVGNGAASSVVEGATGDGDLRKARDYYAACMDESAITAAGTAPIAAELARNQRARASRGAARTGRAPPGDRRRNAAIRQHAPRGLLRVLPAGFAAEVRGRDDGGSGRGAGRHRPAEPRLLPEDRRSVESAATNTVVTSRRC